MAGYVTTNPPHIKTASPLTTGGQTWYYQSADDKATVAAANYFTDAQKRGMRAGDIVEVSVTPVYTLSLHRVTAVSSSGATLSAGLDIT